VIYGYFGKKEPDLFLTITDKERLEFLGRFTELWITLSPERQTLLRRWVQKMTESEARSMFVYAVRQIPNDHTLTFGDVSAAIAFARRSKVVQY
jgi:hypothetical protein